MAGMKFAPVMAAHEEAVRVERDRIDKLDRIVSGLQEWQRMDNEFKRDVSAVIGDMRNKIRQLIDEIDQLKEGVSRP